MKLIFFWGLLSTFITIRAATDSLTIPNGVLIGTGLSPHFVATFALFIALVLLWTIAWGKLLKKVLRLPVIAGQIIGGILLGPSCINIKNFPLFAAPMKFIDTVTGQFYALSSSDLYIFFLLLISSALTVSYLLWIAGHETDIKDILKVRGIATSAGIFGAFFPIIFTIIAVYFCLSHYFTFVESIGLGLVFSATSVSIPVAMLFAQKRMHLKSSKATLGAAIIDDIVAVILLSFFFIALQSDLFGLVEGFVKPEYSAGVIEAILYMIFAFVILFLIGYFAVPSIIKWLKKMHYSHLIAPVANGIMLFYFAFAELVGGLAGITGAYFSGLFHRRGDTEHYAEKVLSPFVNAILLPLFLGSIGLQVNMRIITFPQLGIVMLLLVVAIVSKLAGCFLAAFLSNLSGAREAQRWDYIESFIFGSSMIARGEVGLVIATILHGSRVITAEQYVIAVIVIVLTTIVTPIMLSFGFSRLDIRQVSCEISQNFILNTGLFDIIGTERMFSIIVGLIEKTKRFNTSIQISEGRKILNVQDQDVKIILCPEEGILFEGDYEKIKELIQMIKQAIMDDIKGLSAA